MKYASEAGISPWRLVALLWLAYVINYADRQAVFSIFPALRRDLAFTDAQLGLIGSTFIWVYSVAMPFTGRIADLVRRERVIVVSMALWSAATLGTGLSTSPAAFFAWRAVMGITEALYVPAALALIAAVHSGSTRSKALAIHATAQFAGIIAGGWFGGWMAESAGWRYGFAALAVAGLGYSAVLARVLRGAPQNAAAGPRSRAAPLGVARSPCYVTLAAAFFAFCLMLWMLYAWLPNWIYEHYGRSMAHSGFISTFYLQISTVGGVLAGGALADRLIRRAPAARFYVAAAGLLLCAPFAWLALATSSLGVLKLACAAFGLAAGLFIANLFAAAYDVIAERNYGFGAGALNLFGGAAGGTAVFLAGLWRRSVGIPALMGWAAALTALGAVALLAVSLRHFDADRARARNLP